MAVAQSSLYLLAFAGSIVALLFALLSTMKVLRQDSGSEAMRQIASAIREGAVAYLNRQYKTIAVITIILAVVIAVALKSYILAAAFVLGAFLSALAGYIGMMVSVRANVRTAQAATRSLKDAFDVAFTGGAVTGFAVAGLGLLGVTVLYLILKDPHLLIGFGFGASL
ncbi:sodium/proton-translocating pyrophosphatase, partial [Candidatus Woesearchaeota archaeon]|nr:sodium/proton-translocating pyrophosphatase [Candidatus Woesearchaeota archaeon]